jgi:flavin reductase (DIM6/NTAB) family NADH-FMN oxidoreductase RutF
MHINLEPSILYFGTPVVLISTRNFDGSTNVAPMSSAWWLGWNCMLGLGARSHTAQNLQREKECVLNLPSVAMVDAVNRLARLTGSDPVPPHKLGMGYRHEKDKLGIAGLRAGTSDLVSAQRVTDCPVQLEAVLESTHPFGNRPDKACTALAFEVRWMGRRITLTPTSGVRSS